MPIYEFNCSACDNCFEKLVFGKDEVVCPTCGGNVKRIMSACSFKSAAGDFKTSGSGKSNCGTCSATSCASCR
ncbi:MAG: zinc ribbon domain-containing protein [Pseudomonadota bacterium]